MKEAYAQNQARVVFSFSSLGEFASLWNRSSYNQISQLLFDLENSQARRIRLGQESKVVENILLFKQGVKPLWEDPRNKFGGALTIELQRVRPEELDGIWRELVFSFVGNTFPNLDHVNGIRLMDKMKKKKFVKIEIWIDCGLGKYSSESPEYKNNFIVKENITESLSQIFSKYVEGTRPENFYFQDFYKLNHT